MTCVSGPVIAEARAKEVSDRGSVSQDHGLVLVGAAELLNGDGDSSSAGSSSRSSPEKLVLVPKAQAAKAALVSQEAAQLLDQAGDGSLGERRPQTTRPSRRACSSRLRFIDPS